MREKCKGETFYQITLIDFLTMQVNNLFLFKNQINKYKHPRNSIFCKQLLKNKKAKQRRHQNKVPRGKENVVTLGGLRKPKERIIQTVFRDQLGKSVKYNMHNPVEGLKQLMIAQTSTSWYKSVLKNTTHRFMSPCPWKSVKSARG